MAPFDGRTNPTGLLLFFGAVIILWEALYTGIATGYYGLLPEMFPGYAERTDVAAKMNIFQTVGLIVGVALPPILAQYLGWTWMAVLLSVIAGISIYAGLPAMFERKEYQQQVYIPFLPALKATVVNRSFLTAALAQAMRFFGTGCLQMGMLFYVKYSLKADEGMATVIFGTSFLIAAVMLYPWRQIVANRWERVPR
jgi:glycoside/pentoside/hexuronide:cation symporter, GPH family